MGEVSDVWKQANAGLQERAKESNRPVSLTLAPGKSWRVLLEHKTGHMEKKVIKNSQCGFTKNNPTCLL